METWRKSTYSGVNGGDCVEVADGSGQVAVRDTVDRSGVVLVVPTASWSKFVGQL